jgi:hypothetical protein
MFKKLFFLVFALAQIYLAACQALTAYTVTASAPHSPIHHSKLEVLDQQILIGAHPFTICPFPGQCPGNGDTAFWFTFNGGLDLVWLLLFEVNGLGR